MAEAERTAIDCEEALRRIFEFVDHELEERERLAMEEHLHACESCFSKAEFELRLKERLSFLREGPSSLVRERIAKLIKEF